MNYEENLPAHSSALVEIEKSRAVQEVQAAMIVAKRFPRDLTASYTRIMKSCERLSLAQSATYAYARGGQTVTGPSIRLAEVLAQNYGNLDFGVIELERRDGSSIAEAYCHDLETNVRQRKIFTVGHVRDVKGGGKALTTERDIYEIVANMGARRLRACILGIIPGDFVDDAVARCKKVVAIGDKHDPIEARLRRVALAFDGLSVTQEMLEKRLGHKWSETNGEELAELQSIFNALKDKTARREEFFEFVTAEATTVAQLNARQFKDADEQQRQDVLDRLSKKIADKLARHSQTQIEEAIGVGFDKLDKMNVSQLMAVYEVVNGL